MDAKKNLQIAKSGYQLATVFNGWVQRKNAWGIRHANMLDLEALRLATWENVADLDQYRIADSRQLNWRLVDWYNAIAGTCFSDDADMVLNVYGYRIEPTDDGGFWLYHYCQRVKYYRRRSAATKAALRECKDS